MRPSPRLRSTLPRLRFSFRCLVLRKHDLDFYRIRATGEKWATFIFYCRRCGRIKGNSHAGLSDWPCA